MPTGLRVLDILDNMYLFPEMSKIRSPVRPSKMVGNSSKPASINICVAYM